MTSEVVSPKLETRGSNKQPGIIFLDINMPGMNGWDFLREYAKPEPHQRATAMVVMLTTSENPDDVQQAKTIEAVNDFLNKPLTEEMLMRIVGTQFEVE